MENNPEEATPHFTVSSVLNDAWILIHGIKLATWLPIFGILLIVFILNLIITKIFGSNPSNFVNLMLFPVISNFLIATYYAGAVMITIKKTRGITPTLNDGFQYYKQFLPLGVTLAFISFIQSLLVYFVNYIGPNSVTIQLGSAIVSQLIYTLLILSIPLIADKNYSPLAALRDSILWVRPYWLKVFLLVIIGYGFIILALIPALLGLALNNQIITILGAIIIIIACVWLVPFLFMIHGVIYRLLVDKTPPSIKELI